MKFVAIDVGCLECHHLSVVIGIYDSVDEAVDGVRNALGDEEYNRRGPMRPFEADAYEEDQETTCVARFDNSSGDVQIHAIPDAAPSPRS